MAKTLNVVQNETSNRENNVSDTTENVTENVDAAQEAWNATAHACGFTVENGLVYGAQADALYVIPAPVDFDRVPAFLRNFLFFSIAKHGEYRVAQNAKGDINVAVADFVDSLGGWKPKTSMDAFEAVWRTGVETRLRARIDSPDADKLAITSTYLRRETVDGRPVFVVSTKEDKDSVLFAKIINDTADGSARGTLRDSVIAAALERGKARGEASEGEAAAPKARKGGGADMGADLL